MGSRRSPFAMPEHHIMYQILETHVQREAEFDTESLLRLVETILMSSIQFAAHVVLGTQASLPDLEDKFPQITLTSPFCTIKQISSQMICEDLSEETAHRTTLSILKNLSSYSWNAKAVLAMAAFALDYGEFWLLAQIQPANHQLAKSLAALKQIPSVTSLYCLQKRRLAIVELNYVITATFHVVKIITELQKLSAYGTPDVPALSSAMGEIPLQVYWAINCVVACATQVNCLRSHSDFTQELLQFWTQINIILDKLKKQLIICRSQIEEAENYMRLRRLFETPSDITEVIKGLIITKDDQQPLFDGSTETTASIDALRRKYVLLFISGLDVTEDDILSLRRIHDALKKENQYKIVWIPIVQQWNEELNQKFETLRSRMPWYIVEYFSSVSGIRFIKEEWHLRNDPIIVVMSPQGRVQSPNAMHMVRLWGMNAFPFTSFVEETLSKEMNWIELVVTDIHPEIKNWVEEEKYIFFYGGSDNEWMQKFIKHATALANDATIKEANISIELFCIGKSRRMEEGNNMIARFWTRIESFFLTKNTHRKRDPITRQLQKFLLSKNQGGWALLTKGSKVVISGHGTAILKALLDFYKWKEFVHEKGFEISLKEYHEGLLLPSPSNSCTCIYISSKCCHLPQ